MKLLAAGFLGALIVYEAISWNLSEDPDWEAFIKASPARMARRRAGYFVALGAWALAIWELFS